MANVIWTEQSLGDLDSIAEFIAKDSLYYAKRFVSKIILTVENLSRFNRIGRIVPEFDAESVREIIFHNYRIVYQIDEDEIFILTIIHASLNLRRSTFYRKFRRKG